MRKVVITAGGICTPLGDLKSTWDGLLAGTSGIRLSRLENGLELPLAKIEDLAGRMGSNERQEAFFNRLFHGLPELPDPCNLYCATTKAAADELEKYRADDSGQPWNSADYIANRLGLSGQRSTVSAACVSGLIALIRAAMDIQAGRCDHALVVGFDLLSEFVITGFSSLKALSPVQARPFDRNRDGLTLGDGGGWALLSAADLCSAGNCLAEVNAWGMSCDATHITAPSREGVGLKAVLHKLAGGGRLAIGGINAHGTATPYNDAMELTVFQEMVEEATPVCSVKGSLGHSLGAAGIVEAILCVASLQDGILPPTVGLVSPEETGCVLSGTTPLPLLSPSVVSCNSGFGGINGGVLFTAMTDSCPGF